MSLGVYAALMPAGSSNFLYRRDGRFTRRQGKPILTLAPGSGLLHDVVIAFRIIAGELQRATLFSINFHPAFYEQALRTVAEGSGSSFPYRRCA